MTPACSIVSEQDMVLSPPGVKRRNQRTICPTSSYGSFKNVPVLLIVFKRPDVSRKLVDRLRELGVGNLSTSSDAANGAGNGILAVEVRRVIATGIDWERNVSVNLREKNCPLTDSVVSSVDWFFENVEEGISLEDDCLPSVDFFRFRADLRTLPRRGRSRYTKSSQT
jgi:hypothetical protein